MRTPSGKARHLGTAGGGSRTVKAGGRAKGAAKALQGVRAPAAAPASRTKAAPTKKQAAASIKGPRKASPARKPAPKIPDTLVSLLTTLPVDLTADVLRQASNAVSRQASRELVVIPAEDYAVLRSSRKVAFLKEEMPRAKIERIARNRMSSEHAHLDALMDD